MTYNILQSFFHSAVNDWPLGCPADILSATMLFPLGLDTPGDFYKIFRALVN